MKMLSINQSIDSLVTARFECSINQSIDASSYTGTSSHSIIWLRFSTASQKLDLWWKNRIWWTVFCSIPLFCFILGGLFGQAKTGFGTGTTFGAQPAATTSLFGAQPSSQPGSGGLFGSSNTTTGTGLFGQQSTSSLFGGMSTASSQGPVGTTIKFSPFTGSDAAIKNGQQTNVVTKNYCICTMKEYGEQKSQEELRLEDYQAGRKYGTPQTASSSGGLFGASTQPAQSTGLFGASTTSGFGGTSAFGTNTASKPGGFGTTSGGLFGQPAQPTAALGFFGTPAATPAPAFGGGLFSSQPATTSAPSLFGGFGGEIFFLRLNFQVDFGEFLTYLSPCPGMRLKQIPKSCQKFCQVPWAVGYWWRNCWEFFETMKPGCCLGLCSIDWLIDWLIDGSIDWLIDWLVGYFGSSWM